MGWNGNVDPAGFDPTDPATWPAGGPAAQYTAGDYWGTTAGPFDLAAHGPYPAQNDRYRIYPIGPPTAGTFPAGDVAGWIGTGPLVDGLGVVFADMDIRPYSGCPIGPSLPGWRVVVEMLYDATDYGRLWGEDGYGDRLYGDTVTITGTEWHDVTEPSFSLIVRHGNPDASPYVQISELSIDLVDLDAAAFDFQVPLPSDRPTVGTRVRAAVLDPYQQGHVLFTGRIEAVADDHDLPPRILLIDAYGTDIDLANTIAGWDRPAEAVDVRVDELFTAAAWDWADPATAGGGTVQSTGPDPIDVVARAELDAVALSVHRQADFDRRGRARFRTWPLTPTGPTLEAADCTDDAVDTRITTTGDVRITSTGDVRIVSNLTLGAGYLPTVAVDYVADFAELLNVAEATNRDGTVGYADDPPSIARFGRRSETNGWPVADLMAQQATLDALTADTVARFAGIVNRAARLEVTTAHTADWAAVLADLDTGQAAAVARRGITGADLDLDAVVVGFEHRITVNRWDTTVYLSTVTESI